MAPRLKSKATVNVPQSKTECAEAIKRIGDFTRDFTRLRADMNDRIAAITAEVQPLLEQLQAHIQAEQDGVQRFCEANRETLCAKGTKTAGFITGEVSWRQRPPSVAIRGADAVLETLLRMGLGRFVRVKQEPNKEAMLNEPEALRGIAGITITTGVEDFIITPVEVQAEVA